MNNFDTVYNNFVKRLETEKELTIDEIKEAEDFKKLSEVDQKRLEERLRRKLDIIKKQKSVVKKSKDRKFEKSKKNKKRN